MGIVLAFVVGYVTGARAGVERLEEITVSLRAVADSDEFQNLVRALRSHASVLLNDMSRVLADTSDQRLTIQEILDRMRDVVKPVVARPDAS